MATKPVPGQREKDLEAPHLIQRYWDAFFRQHPVDIQRQSEAALDWFRKRVSKDLHVKAESIIKSSDDYKRYEGKHDRTMVGKLYLFSYEAVQAGDEYTQTFDQYPMVFFFNVVKTQDGRQLFYGLNMHYLTPKERAAVYSGLLKLKSKKGITPRTRLRLEWDLIKGVCKHPLVERAVHAYRVDRIKSKMVEIPATDWQIALFLKLDRWKHVSGFDTHQSTARSLVTRSYKRPKLK